MRIFFSIICMIMTALCWAACHIFALLSWVVSYHSDLFVFLMIFSFLLGLFFLIVDLFYIGSEPLDGSQMAKQAKKVSKYRFK